MINRLFNGVDIGDSAVQFFDRLAYHESSGSYTDNSGSGIYVGRYQMGTDVLYDIGWWSNSKSGWSNGKFIGKGAEKYKLTDKNSFLKNPSAQDEAVMLSMIVRWKSVKSLQDKICSRIKVDSDSTFRNPSKVAVSDAIVYKTIASKKAVNSNMKCQNPKGREILITSSGLVVASHLCGQGAMREAISNNFKGKYGIPVDGNKLPSTVYLEDMGGYDLSVIIGYKDSCSVGDRPVLQNNKNVDKKITNSQARTETESTLGINEEGVFIFEGKKYEERNTNDEYIKDWKNSATPPNKVFVNISDVVINRLNEKFNSEEYYKKDYIKYVEEKTERKVLDKNKDQIALMLKAYDEQTKDDKGIGNIIKQVNFDIFRGLELKEIPIKIQDVAYYIFTNPFQGKNGLEALEYSLKDFSAKYVIYPDVQSIEINKNEYEYRNNQITSRISKDKEKKVMKNQVPEKYNIYLEGKFDVDEINYEILKKDQKEWNTLRCENLLKSVRESQLHKESYKHNEDYVRVYPKARRFLDNLMEEFIKIQCGYKNINEAKSFDNHNYEDSNILRNYLIWYDQKYKIDMPSKNENGLFLKLSKIGSKLRVTTVLNEWINSKSNMKTSQIREIHRLILVAYSKYTDGSTKSDDESIIKGHFKSLKELRDYVADKDAINIYPFYKEFYELKNEINPNDEYYVNTNGILKCTFGEGTSNLIIAARGIKLHGAEKANIKDKTITPFKNCKGGKCVPNFVSDWQKTTETQVANQPALLDISTIMCARGGIVSIDDPGQKQITTAATKQKQIVESKREYDCEYTSLVNICTTINSKFMQTDLKKRCVEYRKAKKRYNELKLQREALITGNKSIVQKSPTEELKKLKKIKYPNSLEKARIAMLENIINANIKKNSDKLDKIDKEIAIQKSKVSGKTHDVLVVQIKYTSILAGLTAINLSKAKKDTKGLHKKYGGISCDIEKSKFYNVSVLGTIVEGYLLEAADIANVPLTKKQYEQEVADEILKKQEEQGIPYWQRNSKETTDNDYINTKYNIKTNVQAEAQEKYKIAKNIDLGVQLYRDIKNIPTGQDIVKKIREGEKSVVNCPFNVAEKSAREGGEVKSSNNTSSTTPSKNQTPAPKQSGTANTQKPEAKENTGKSNERCPVNGECEYIFYIERVENFNRSTLSKFYIEDSTGYRYTEYDGYIIEPEGPDTEESNRNKRIVSGNHKIFWHFRPKAKHLYWAPQITSGRIPESRAILIHFGGGRNWTIGCLIPTKSPYKGYHKKYGKIYKCDIEKSKEYFNEICNFIERVENSGKKKEGLKINKIKLVVFNNIIK